MKSAGNGPAMRAAVVGLVAPVEELTHFVIDATRLTHIEPMAEDGAAIVAGFVRYARDPQLPRRRVHMIREMVELAEKDGRSSLLWKNLGHIDIGFEFGMAVDEFASSLDLARGVTGYIAHTVPVAIYAFLRHPDDYRTAVESVIRCGGDTDTVAAITGALVGTRVGKAGIPKEWLDRWCDWPRSIRYIEKLGERLAEGKWRTAPQPAVGLAWWAIPFRNLFFFLVVLCHVVRRLFPPY